MTSVNNCLNNRFCLADGSVLAAHKLVLAITSSVFKGMFFGPLADENLSQVNFEDDEHNLASITLILQVRVEDVKPAGFKRLIHKRLINTTRSTGGDRTLI